MSIYIPFVEALEQMPSYMNFMKNLVTKKRMMSLELANNVYHCSTVAF